MMPAADADVAVRGRSGPGSRCRRRAGARRARRGWRRCPPTPACRGRAAGERGAERHLHPARCWGRSRTTPSAARTTPQNAAAAPTHDRVGPAPWPASAGRTPRASPRPRRDRTSRVRAPPRGGPGSPRRARPAPPPAGRRPRRRRARTPAATPAGPRETAGPPGRSPAAAPRGPARPRSGRPSAP